MVPKENPVRADPPPYLPEGLELHEDGRGLHIVRRWFKPTAFLLLFFCFSWNSVAGSFFWEMLGAENLNLFALVISLIFLAPGVAICYFTLALFLNRTTVVLDRGKLTVRHSPLPWKGQLELEAAEIEQLYCKERTRRSKNSVSKTYEVMLRTARRGEQVLVRGLEDPDQARYFEQRIEGALGLSDEGVSGEYEPRSKAAVPEEPSEPTRAQRTTTLEAPAGVTVGEVDGVYRIVMRWFKLKDLIVLLFLNAAWNGVLWFLYDGLLRDGDASWMQLTFPIAHVAIGALLAYSALVQCVNRTRFELDRDELRVTHYPLPWPGKCRVPIDSIEQLYCAETKPKQHSNDRVTYDLRVRLTDGIERKLLKSQTSPERIQFLEQELELELGLGDERVEGELRRRR